LPKNLINEFKMISHSALNLLKGKVGVNKKIILVHYTAMKTEPEVHK